MRLSAIGFTQTQILVEAVNTCDIIPITIGALLGAVGGGLRFRSVSGRLRPHPRAASRACVSDWVLVLGGYSAFVVALTLWTVVALALSGRASRAVRPSPVGRGAGHPQRQCHCRRRLATGVRSSGTGARFGARSVVGVLLSVAGVVAASDLRCQSRSARAPTVSLRHELRRVRRRQRLRVVAGPAVAALDASPDVTSLTLFAGSQARSATNGPDARPRSSSRTGQPTMLEGRLPASETRSPSGELTASDVDAEVGDDVELAGPTSTRCSG